jgi:hypothetical protein
MDERDVIRKWRDLFKGQGASPQALVEAEKLLDGLSGESPLHLRLAGELQELKHGKAEPKKRAARAAKKIAP